MIDLDRRSDEERIKLKEETVRCMLDNKNHYTYMGSSVLKKHMGVLIKVMQKNKDFFA